MVKDFEGNDFCEMILKLVVMFENLFCKSFNKIVFCDVWCLKDEFVGNYS